MPSRSGTQLRMKQRLKRHKIVDEKAKVGEEDLFAKLSDDVLVSIISLLDMKEAARTSVFSHRWTNLWRQYSGSLNFDEPELISELEEKMECFIPDSACIRFLRWVNDVVEKHRGPKIDELRVRFNLERSHGHLIDKWLDFALVRSVERIDLDLQPLYYQMDDDNMYCLPDKYLKFSTSLQNQTFRTLTSFSVNSVNVSGEFLEMLLINCPLLEHLSVRLSNHLRSLKVTSAPLKLKHLGIYNCMNVEKFEVFAPSLLSLKYHGPPGVCCINGASCLSEVSIGVCAYGIEDEMAFIAAFSPLSSYLPRLTILHIEIFSAQVRFPSDQFLVLSSLKQLHLCCVAYDHHSFIYTWADLLEASPILQKFTFSLSFLGESSGRELITRQNVQRPFENLKELELIGFEGAAVDTEVAVFCLDNSPVIEKLVVDRRRPSSMHRPSAYVEAKEKKVAEQRALELQRKLPANATFVLI